MATAGTSTGQKPVGPETQSNSFTNTSQLRPRAALLEDGGYVLVWAGNDSPGSDANGAVVARMFLADGQPVGPDFQVNQLTSGLQQDPSIAALPGGGFVVAWRSELDDDSRPPNSDTYVRTFSPDGEPLMSDLRVNQDADLDESAADVAVAPDGTFLVAFHRTGAGSPQPGDIFGRKFSAAGLPVSDEFRINSQSPGGQFTPRVAANPDGRFLVVWYSDTSSGTDHSSRSIQSRWLGADGVPLGSDRQVNSLTLGEQRQPSLAFDATGGYLVSWESFSSAGTDPGLSVQARYFSANGKPQGEDFQLNEHTTGAQFIAQVASHPEESRFLVVWTSWLSAESDQDNLSVQGRLVTMGAPSGPEFQLHTLVWGAQARATGLFLTDDRFVTVWDSLESSGTDNDLSSIQMRHFSVEPAGFVDGFERGDLSRWSAVVR